LCNAVDLFLNNTKCIQLWLNYGTRRLGNEAMRQ
jgi:hypothetical protein